MESERPTSPPSPNAYSTAPSSPSELSVASSVTLTDDSDWIDFGSLPYETRHRYFDLLLLGFRLQVNSRWRAARVLSGETPTASPSPSNASVSSLDLEEVPPPIEPEPEYANAQVQTNLVAINTTEDLTRLTRDLPEDFWDDDLSEGGEPRRGERVVEYAEDCLREWFETSTL